MGAKYSTTAYRYPNEYPILALTMVVVLFVIAFTVTATVCLSAIFVPLVVIWGYFSGLSNHRALVSRAQMVTSENSSEVFSLLEENSARLQVEEINVFILPSQNLNAYTFGLHSPKAVVLYSSLFQIMDRDEIQFILGHEMGHVRLGHTWLNTLVGGMAGIPSSLGAAAIMELAFRWWNRACEYSADRAGVLACGKPNKAVSALIKLETGVSSLNQDGLQAVIQHLESDDEDILHNLEETLASHPMVAKRIDEIRHFASTRAYREMQSRMDQNLSG